MSNSMSIDLILDELLSNYVDQLNTGQKSSMEDFLASHPTKANELRPLLQALVKLRTELVMPELPQLKSEALFQGIIKRLQQETSMSGETTNVMA